MDANDVVGEGNRGGNFGRTTQHHDPDSFWRSTGCYIWDQVMGDAGPKFSDIAVADLEGDNSMQMLTNFKDRAINRPPIQKNGSAPYAVKTVATALRTLPRMLIKKLYPHLGTVAHEAKKNEFFPDADVKKLSNAVAEKTSRVLMEGHGVAGDIGKKTHPIPREESDRTRVFPPDDIPPNLRQHFDKPIDLLHIANYLFGHEKFTELLMILLTNNGIGRGGEVKFLTYSTMFLDNYYGVLFLQWFQRKTLKTNPSGFVPDFVHPNLCVFFAFGCYWACANGLHRVHGIGEPNSPRRRQSQFVFPNLHANNDSSVAKKVTDTLQSYLPAVLAPFFRQVPSHWGHDTFDMGALCDM